MYKDELFKEFKKKYAFPEEDEEIVRNIWEDKVRISLNQQLARARTKALSKLQTTNIIDCINNGPIWIQKEDWNTMIQEVWSTDGFQRRSDSSKRNRLKQTDGKISSHSGGSVSFAAYRASMQQQAGGKELPWDDVFSMLHQNANETGTFVDNRSKTVVEHNLGSDVPLKNPDRNVSSFAMQLKYAQALESALVKTNNGPRCNSNLEPAHMDDNNNEVTDSPENEFENLADTFRELGYCMMELGLRVAQICDMAIGGQELERSLLESGTAKGRLIHYHSVLDNLLVKASGRRKGSTKKQAYCEKNQVLLSISELKQSKCCNLITNGNEVGSSGNQGNLWQQWHYDYGIFTVLTAPMFLMSSQLTENTATDQFPVSCDQDCACPTGHSYLQIFDANKNDVFMVKTSSESFIIQVGESADILSRGKLSSTLHCVRRPPNFENLSRETFVVFLQPAWSKTFSISDYNVQHGMSGHHSSNEGNGHTELDFNEAAQDIHKIVPPLSSRLKDGMTFAEFSRETTKQYYGGSGLQSNS